MTFEQAIKNAIEEYRRNPSGEFIHTTFEYDGKTYCIEEITKWVRDASFCGYHYESCNKVVVTNDDYRTLEIYDI